MVPPNVPASGGAATPLDTAKLRHVLQWPIRQLLGRHGVAQTKYRTASTDELIRLVEAVGDVSQQEVDDLYDEYRYGTRATFYLYFIPPSEAPLQSDALTAEVATALGAAAETEIDSDDGDEAGGALRNLRVLDDDAFASIAEVRLSYEKAHHYIDVEGNPDHVWELRYAFLWVDEPSGFVAVITRDRSLCRIVIPALGRVLGHSPIPPELSRKMIDSVVSSTEARRMRLVDADGIGRIFTGLDHTTGQGRVRVQAELVSRLNSGEVPRGGLYTEAVSPGVNAGLGISVANSSLSLTRVLSRSQLRNWGASRLVGIVRALRQAQPAQLNIARGLYSVRKVPSGQRRGIQAILKGALSARLSGASTGVLEISVEDLVAQLGERVQVSLLTECPICLHEEPLRCRRCAGTAVDFHSTSPWCPRCNRPFEGACASDHDVALSDPLSAAFIVPDDGFRRDLIRRMEGAELDEDRGFVAVWHRAVIVGERPDDKPTTYNITVMERAKAALNIHSPGGVATST